MPTNLVRIVTVLTANESAKATVVATVHVSVVASAEIKIFLVKKLLLLPTIDFTDRLVEEVNNSYRIAIRLHS